MMISQMARPVRMSCLLALAWSWLAACAAAPTTAATPVAPVANDSPLSAYGGWVVWSERVGGTGAEQRWALMAWHDGRKVRLPVHERHTPFDADVGPNVQGRPVVLFSRCKTDPLVTTDFTLLDGFATPAGLPAWRGASDCRLRRLDLRSGRESAVDVLRVSGASDTTPSQWHGRIVFGRRLRRSTVTQLEMWSVRRHRLTRLRHGSLPHGCGFQTGCDPDSVDGDVQQVDLGERFVAFVWEVHAPTVSGVGPGWELRADTISTNRTALLASGAVGGACGAGHPVSPTVTGTDVVFDDLVSPDCDISHTLLTRGDAKTGRTGTLNIDPQTAWQSAVDGTVLYTIRGPRPAQTSNDVPCLGTAAPCVLVAQPATDVPRGDAAAHPPFVTR